MPRIQYLALFSLVILSLMGETESLASLVFNIRQNGVFGILGGGRNNFPLAKSESVMPITPVSLPISQDVGGFDPDEYRKEITDLVYERNLKRFSS